MKVILSCESKFNVVGFDGGEWCWKRDGEPLSTRVISKIMKQRGGSIVVWGCMSQEGIGKLTKIEGKMNSEHYHNILHDNMRMPVVKFKKISEGVGVPS